MKKHALSAIAFVFTFAAFLCQTDAQTTPPGGKKPPDCATCSDTKKIKCFNCGAEGKVRVPCDKCLSSEGEPQGKVPCDRCAGVGTMTCPKCGGSGKVREMGRHDDVGCTRCGAQASRFETGSGRIKCPYCRNGFDECRTCKGTKKVPAVCLFCEGTKKVECPNCTELVKSPELTKFKEENAQAILKLEQKMPREDREDENPHGASRFAPPQVTQKEDMLILSFCIGFEKQQGRMPSWEAIVETARTLLKLCIAEGWCDRVCLLRVTATLIEFDEKGKEKKQSTIALLTWYAEALKEWNWVKKPHAFDLMAIAAKKAFHADIRARIASTEAQEE